MKMRADRVREVKNYHTDRSPVHVVSICRANCHFPKSSPLLQTLGDRRRDSRYAEAKQILQAALILPRPVPT